MLPRDLQRLAIPPQSLQRLASFLEVRLRLGKRLGPGISPRVLGLFQLARGRAAQCARLLLFSTGAFQNGIGLVPPPANVLEQAVDP